MKIPRACAGLVILSLLLTTPALASNIVLNPGFESGANDFNGNVDDWANVGWGLGLIGIPPTSHTGIGVAARNGGPEELLSNSFSQVLSTAAGQTYDMSFWIAETSLSLNELIIQWDGTTIADFVDPTGGSVCDFSPADGYTCPWIQVVVPNLTANSDSTLLQLFGRQDQGYLLLDDFSVDAAATTTSAVPEPGSVMLVGAGILALAARRRSRRTALRAIDPGSVLGRR